MKCKINVIFISLLLWPFLIPGQDPDRLATVSQTDSTVIIESPCYFMVDSTGNQLTMIIDTLEGRKSFSAPELDSAREFTHHALQQFARQHQKKIQLAQTYDPAKIESNLKFLDSFQDQSGDYLYVQAGDFILKLREIDLKRLETFCRSALGPLDTSGVMPDPTTLAQDSISQSSQMIESDLLLIPAAEDSIPYMGFSARNIWVTLDSSALLNLYAYAAQRLKQIEQAYQTRAEEMRSTDLLTIKSPVKFKRDFKKIELTGMLFDSLNIFIPVREMDMYRLHDMLAQIETDTMPALPPDQPDTTKLVISQPDTTDLQSEPTVEPLIPEEPRIITSPIHTFDSFQDQGGSFIYIDSLNTALALEQEQLAQLLDFLNKKSDLPVRKKDLEHQEQPITRYYATDLTARELVASEISAQAAQNQSHFQASFSPDGKLFSFEFIEKPKATGVDKSELRRNNYSRWNIVLNDSINYYNNARRRIDIRARIFRDKQNRVMLAEYLNSSGQMIATGQYFYGFKNIIIEQRIEFEPGYDLTDAFPHYFDLNFNGLQPGWLVKGLYNDQGRLRRLVVMDEHGNLYYHYRFEYSQRDNQLCATIFVYNESNQLASRYALYFNRADILSQKINYNHEGVMQQKRTFAIDIRKQQMIIDIYNPDDQLINRIYKPF